MYKGFNQFGPFCSYIFIIMLYFTMELSVPEVLLVNGKNEKWNRKITESGKDAILVLRSEKLSQRDNKL